MYYTCEYYNAYVAFCREPSQSLDSYFSFNRLKGMGQAGISFDHRGSSAAGDAPELTACGRPPFLLSVSTEGRNFLNFDHRGSSPPGVDKGAHPLMFIPALATCASERIKTEGFCTLRVLPPGNEVRGKTRKPSEKWLCHFTERRQPQYLLQFRNKKPLTSVTFGGNI